MSAAEESLATFLRLRVPLFDEKSVGNFASTGVEMVGLRAWCTLPDGTPPNETRWAHVGDLDALADELRQYDSNGGLRRVG